MNDVARIAAALSKAQERLVLDETCSIGNPPTIIPCGDARVAARTSTVEALLMSGIFEKTRFGLSFSPLGIAVANHLKGQS